MLKKSILIVACLLSITLVALIVVTNLAHADTANWARILKDDVYLYKTENIDQPLFILEKSYYVRVLQEFDSVLQVEVIPSNDVEFVPIVGYVIRSEVSMCVTPPVEPYYPAEVLTVTADSVDIKLSPVPSSTSILAALNLQPLYYYGKQENYGTTWYYVRYAGRFGYVDARAVSQPQVAFHPTPLPNTPSSTTPTTPDETPSDTTPVESSPTSEILLIAFVVLFAVGLTLALFLPGNFKKRNNVFEQDI
ncbi:MAG: hypothetical protein J1F65_01690 [Clostridiales bacterium]|nr:hypothetical protein [Clostridiales bacterium]